MVFHTHSHFPPGVQNYAHKTHMKTLADIEHWNNPCVFVCLRGGLSVMYLKW